MTMFIIKREIRKNIETSFDLCFLSQSLEREDTETHGVINGKKEALSSFLQERLIVQ